VLQREVLTNGTSSGNVFRPYLRRTASLAS